MNEKLRNVSTAITSVLTALAAAPYQLGEVGNFIPPEWKQRIFIVGLVATFILRTVKPTPEARP
jgi:hypothetical protein